MKTIIQDVLEKINWSHTLKSIADKGIEKLTISSIGATMMIPNITRHLL